MPYLGICCASLKDNKALMKIGLGLVLVGHVNFLLGALVHGVVLRHITFHQKARSSVYAISNVIAIVAGLVGIMVGILTIVSSKNKKNRILVIAFCLLFGKRWVMLVPSFLAGLLGMASAVGLTVSMGQAIINRAKSLLTHCDFTDEINPASITYECLFDPTRIYATTLILWIPLIVMSVVEMVFSFRCFAACTSSLYLCPCRRKPVQAKKVRIQQRVEISTAPSPEEPDEEPAEEHELLDNETTL